MKNITLLIYKKITYVTNFPLRNKTAAAQNKLQLLNNIKEEIISIKPSI